MDILHQLSSMKCIVHSLCYLMPCSPSPPLSASLSPLLPLPFPLLTASLPCSPPPLFLTASLPCSPPLLSLAFPQLFTTDLIPITTKCHTMSKFLSCFKQLPCIKACQPVCIVRIGVHPESNLSSRLLQVLDHYDHFEDAKFLRSLEHLAELVSG